MEPIIATALNGKQGYVASRAQLALRQLAFIDPSAVLPRALDSIYDGTLQLFFSYSSL